MSKSMTVMELPSRSVWWDLNSRQHLQYGQRRRSFLLVCGADAAQVSEFKRSDSGQTGHACNICRPSMRSPSQHHTESKRIV